MASSSKRTAALELGFPEKHVTHALSIKTFVNAGQLVDFLDDNEEELTTAILEKERKAAEASSGRGTSSEKVLSLREETERLYRMSLCLACWKRPRTIVLLPCGHYALCSTCNKHKEQCPMKDCGEKILCSISTFL